MVSQNELEIAHQDAVRQNRTSLSSPATSIA
jgi:hypothetical protein